MADEVTAATTVKQRPRRVRFAELACVHEFVREEDGDEVEDGDEELEQDGEEEDEDGDAMEDGSLLGDSPASITVTSGSSTSNDKVSATPCATLSGALEVVCKTGYVEGKPWSSLFNNNTARMNLSFVTPPQHEHGFLHLGDGTSMEGEEKWKNTIVGDSLDRKIPFKLLEQRALSLWKTYGLQEVRANKEGFYFFSFQAKEGMNVVLNKGPWVILGQQFFLKPWIRNFEFRKEEFKTIRNWIKLFGIPMTYWTPSGLSAIASKVGVPLYADEITSEARILEFARVCVEMQAGSEFPTSFKVQTEHNEVFEVRVEYSWRPRNCSLCKVFGHSTISCPTNETQLTRAKPTEKLKHWRPKNHNLTSQSGHNDPEPTKLPPLSKPLNLTIQATKNSLIQSPIPSCSNSFSILEEEALVEGFETENGRLGDLDESNSGRCIEEGAKCEVAMSMSMVHSEQEPLVKGSRESRDGKVREEYKSDHNDALNLNAKSEEEEKKKKKEEEEGKVHPTARGRKVNIGDKINRKRSKRIKKSTQRKEFAYSC